jgi:hypothetical protein
LEKGLGYFRPLATTKEPVAYRLNQSATVFLAVLNRIVIRVSQALRVRGGSKGLDPAFQRPRRGGAPRL